MADRDEGRRIVMTGASGMVGTALSAAFRQEGSEVVSLSHTESPGAITWDSATSELDPAIVSGATAVINLAGENLADGRWTRERKAQLHDSRVLTTAKLSQAIAGAAMPPQVFISVSAVGFYGDRGDEILTEASDPGDDFLAQLCIDWEAACLPARDADVRVVNPRFGMILSPHGGGLDKMLPIFRAGVGGRFGNGQQWLSWIAIDDVIGAVLHVMAHAELFGPVNFTSPTPVRNVDFAHALGEVLHRPALVPAPAVALRLALGEMADDALLASQRAVPRVLTGSGFVWQYGEVKEALAHVTDPAAGR